ncbi:MAG: ABC transporter substrate-binding protein [Deltaproteobacteria bacterium]|nr:ABC transporter substrate-binding protein [Deltaproteobacteria bacterium]
MRGKGAVIGTVILLLGLTVQAGSIAAGEREITLRTDWLFRGYHAPFFVALKKGYFAEQGVGVQLQEGRGSATVMQLVANQSATFGFVDGAVMAMGVDKGMPLKMVAGIFQRTTAAMMVYQGSGIENPRDMAGKTAGLVPGANTTQLFPIFLQRNGVAPEAVKVINVTPANKTTFFRQRKYDITSALINDEVPALRLQGEQIKVFHFADYGVNTMSLGVVTHPQMLSSSPETVRRFLAAAIRGWEFAASNPEEAVSIFLASVEARVRDVSLEQLRIALTLLHTDATRGRPLGWMAQEDWQKTQDFLVQSGAMKGRHPLDAFYTNALLPGGS